MDSGPVLAIDVGGTKLAAAVVLPSGVVLGASVRPTPQGASASVLFSALLDLLRSVVGSVGLRVVGAGVGCGGPMEWPAGIVSPVNIPGWRSFPLASSLASELGVPVRIHNDAVCAAIAEHWRGAGRGHSSMLGMVVSTGVGGGLVLGGRVWDGATGNAGHVGHIVVDPDGPVCGCGGRGCLEAVARGPAVVTWALTQGWTPGRASTAPGASTGTAGTGGGIGGPGTSHAPGGGAGGPGFGSLGELSGAADDQPYQPGDHREVGSAGEGGHQVGKGDRQWSAADGRALAADARAGDAVALAAYERAGTMLGRGIASAVAAYDVTTVVVGGGFAASGDLLFEPLRRAYEAHAGLPFVRAATIVPAALGAETGLLGAAALVLEEDRYWPRAR